MSAGHPHRRPNEAHPLELKKLLAEPTAAAMMAKPPRLVVDFDVPDVGGYPVIGDWRYIDSDFVRAARSGQMRVPGMTGQQIVQAILHHEWVEKVLLDADNGIDSYQAAHEFATLFEHEFVRSLGVTPKDYERGIGPMLAVVEKKKIVRPPLDLDCEPYLDHPDAQDKLILADFVRLGVHDANKATKESVQYGKSAGQDRCGGCKHWKSPRDSQLSACEVVAGAVRSDRWCSRYQEGVVEGDNDYGEAQQNSSRLQSGRAQDQQGVGDPQPGGGTGGIQPQGESSGPQGQPSAKPSEGVT